MYVNQIDNIIDKTLDKLYLDGISKDPTFRTLVEGKKINFVEYRDKINKFIQQFMQTIDIDSIQKLIQNKENLVRILDIIKRYIAYYYFLSLAYYYTGTIKNFRNNLIQYSKLQETSDFNIRNFFDTENNYQIIKYFKIIKDVSKIITMTELQRKTLNPLEIKDAIDFLKTLDTEYINNFLLMIVEKGDDKTVEINVHNLIKTIVFGQIYRNQERNMVFEILNDIEENKHEYRYIDIVITTEDASDFESFRQIFAGEEDSDIIAKDLFELVNDQTRIPVIPSNETKNNNLLELKMITPIVDDFLRYHRDSERLDVEADKPFIIPLVSNNNAKNVQLALLYQQRKKKENTKAQLIVNKIDAISDLYSENVKKNTDAQRDVKKYFQNPFAYRKAVMINYLDEVRVMNKIRNQGRKVIEGNEYFLELVEANRRAYFNFKDFQKYGTSVSLTNDDPINLLRYANIESQNQLSNLQIDMHTAGSDSVINVVGLSLGPFDNEPVQCIRKENLVDIRGMKISYIKNNEVVTRSTENGFKAFLKIIKHFFINTINIIPQPFKIYNDFSEVRRLNPDIYNKLIYWIYDIEKDEYEMETYENIKSNNFQENIKFMNSVLYDKIIELLNKKLVKILNEHNDLPIHKIEAIVEIFSSVNKLFLKEMDKNELIVNEYLRIKPIEESKIKTVGPTIEMPEFIPITEMAMFRIKIDVINPLHPQEYVKLEAYTKEGQESIISKVDSKCQHEIEWKELNKLRTENLNRYNAAVTEFIEKFAIETTELDFICRICGQLLPLKQYVQDGSFDNNTQRFVTAYVPLDIALEEVKEYRKYQLTIKYLDVLINSMSLITGTNMLVGPNIQIKQKRKALIKNIIDIIVKHNSINLKKKMNDDERLEFFSKKFHINKDLDNVFFFELDDNIFNFTPTGSEKSVTLNRLKFNNVLLYFILIFITELNGAQIAMMSYDKIANIYNYLKYGPKLFGNLLIKKNINDMETVPIDRYPVLCYLLFLISYYLIKYKRWYYPATTSKTFNPVLSKIIINSFVDILNGISMEAGRLPNDYTYLLTTSKLYSQLNTTFKNNDIINVLKSTQIKFSDKKDESILPLLRKEIIKQYPIANPIKIVLPPRKIPNYKISYGINFDRDDDLLYPEIDINTDITNCPYGSYHYWISKGDNIECILCGEKGEEHDGKIVRSQETYYYVLNKIANRRCLEGTVHDFVGRDGNFVCTICGRRRNEIFTISDRIELSNNVYKKEKENIINVESLLNKFARVIKERYSNEDLNKLANNLTKLEDENIQNFLRRLDQLRMQNDEEEMKREQMVKDLIKSYNKETNNKLYGEIVKLVDILIDELENIIGKNVNVDIGKYPVYLRDNVYIIDHTYNGSILQEPIILTGKDNRVIFKENHPFFKTDVYYYTDNRLQIDIFYQAVTLKLLGYKEKHKEYVLINKSNNYLKIIPSIKERILTIGFETKYINIGEIFDKNSKIIKDAKLNYYQILDGLIREHIFKIRSIIDKFILILYKVKYYDIPQETEIPSFLQSYQEIDKLTSKYFKLLKNFNLGENNQIMDDWSQIRDYFHYEKVNWAETNVGPMGSSEKISLENMYVNADLINYYDTASSIMVYYLVNKLISILQDNNKEKIIQNNLSQFYVETINYIYKLYNIDAFKNSMEIKRFDYILNGSEMMIDLLRKGQGLVQSRELEQNLDDVEPDLTDITTEEKEDVEDLREEAEALDIDTDYYAEEEGDYVEGGDAE